MSPGLLTRKGVERGSLCSQREMVMGVTPNSNRNKSDYRTESKSVPFRSRHDSFGLGSKAWLQLGSSLFASF